VFCPLPHFVASRHPCGEAAPRGASMPNPSTVPATATHAAFPVRLPRSDRLTSAAGAGSGLRPQVHAQCRRGVHVAISPACGALQLIELFVTFGIVADHLVDRDCPTRVVAVTLSWHRTTRSAPVTSVRGFCDRQSPVPLQRTIAAKLRSTAGSPRISINADRKGEATISWRPCQVHSSRPSAWPRQA